MKTLQAACAICLAVLMGCTSSRALRAPVSDRYELNSGPYHIELKTGETYKVANIKVSNDSAFFGDHAVPLKAIRSIEIRWFNYYKTAGLVIGAGIVACAALTTVLLFAVLGVMKG